MKKMICLLLTACLLISMAACGAGQTETGSAPEAAASETQAAEWSREGYYADENGNMLSVTYMDDIDEPGWYIGFMNGEDLIEDSYGGTLRQEGNTLHGTVVSGGEQQKELTITITEEDENGLKAEVDGGETYHFKPYEMPEPVATLRVNTEGLGTFLCVEDGAEGADDEALSSLQYGLEEPAAYILTAIAGDGWYFDKWTLNGEDYSADEQITVEVSQDTDLVAVFLFADADDGQNPAMCVIGEYASGRAKALVECEGEEDAKITIEWGGSVSELAKWVMSGRFDGDTLTVEYDNCVKSIVTYGEDGAIADETIEYEDGTGTVVFDIENNSFTWKGDQDGEEEMVFEWSFVPVEIDLGSSEKYTDEDLYAAVGQINIAFAEYEGCEMHSIRYAGDESDNEENLAWLNDLNPEGKYTQVAEFLTDFHSPAEGSGALEPDMEYTDYQWWLGRADGGEWEVVSRGY